MTWKDEIRKAKRYTAQQSDLDTDEAEEILDDLQLLIERMEKNYDELVSVTSYVKTEEEQSQKKITEFIDRLKNFVDFLENNAMSEM
mgnify:CR=1 FL=1|tara:strand:- start:51 stop:311 length:261 start_codon:yes stop_codon:yes gene_type:complete